MRITRGIKEIHVPFQRQICPNLCADLLVPTQNQVSGKKEKHYAKCIFITASFKLLWIFRVKLGFPFIFCSAHTQKYLRLWTEWVFRSSPNIVILPLQSASIIRTKEKEIVLILLLFNMHEGNIKS